MDCRKATAIDPSFTLKRFHHDRPECFVTRLESRGLLALDAAVPGFAGAEPRIDFLGRACDASGAADGSFRYEERSPGAIVVEIRKPGSYAFCVGPQDPARPLAELVVRSGYAGETADTKEGDPEEDEPPPDPKARAIRAICRLGEIDDHGDRRLCATPVERSAAGEIGDRRGDDHDYFALSVAEVETVLVRSTGDTDTFGSLYDGRGFRIAADDDGGAGANFRIVKALVPGRYFVRVEGRDGARGPYRVEVGPLR